MSKTIMEIGFRHSEQVYLHVDGVHIRDQNKEKRSFEVMISTVFKSESYRKISEDKNVIENKHVLASALNDHENTINALTIKATQKKVYQKILSLLHFAMVQPIAGALPSSLTPYCKNIRLVSH